MVMMILLLLLLLHDLLSLSFLPLPPPPDERVHVTGCEEDESHAIPRKHEDEEYQRDVWDAQGQRRLECGREGVRCQVRTGQGGRPHQHLRNI